MLCQVLDQITGTETALGFRIKLEYSCIWPPFSRRNSLRNKQTLFYPGTDCFLNLIVTITHFISYSLFPGKLARGKERKKKHSLVHAEYLIYNCYLNSLGKI